MTALPPEVLKELQEEYLASFSELLALVKIAVVKSDWKAIEAQFHKFAGSGSTYGLPLITDVARDIKNYIIKNVIPNQDHLNEALAKFEKVVENYKSHMGLEKSS